MSYEFSNRFSELNVRIFVHMNAVGRAGRGIALCIQEITALFTGNSLIYFREGKTDFPPFVAIKFPVHLRAPVRRRGVYFNWRKEKNSGRPIASSGFGEALNDIDQSGDANGKLIKRHGVFHVKIVCTEHKNNQIPWPIAMQGGITRTAPAPSEEAESVCPATNS